MGPTTIELPQYLRDSAGTPYAVYTDPADYTFIGGVGEQDTERTFEGNPSIRTVNTLGTYGTKIRKAVSYSAPAPPKRAMASVYITDPAAVYSVHIGLITGGTASRATLTTSLFPLHVGWNTLLFLPQDWDGWDVDFVYTEFEISVGTIDTLTVTESNVGAVYFDPVGVAAIAISFDDNFESVHTNALPVMAAHNIPGTSYIISDLIGGSGRLSVAQMQDLADAGWDIANHTKAYAIDSVASLTDCQDALEALGFTQASRHVAYPNGTTNTAIMGYMYDAGMLTGRLARSPISGYRPAFLSDGGGVNLRIMALGLQTNTLTLQQAKTYVDDAIANRYLLCMFSHQINDTPGDYDWTTADFTALMEYIASKGLPCLTITDIYESLSGPVQVAVAA